MKSIVEYITESLTEELFEFLDGLKRQQVIFAPDNLKNKYHIKELTISKTLNNSDEYVTIDKIIVDNKGNGHGSVFMRDLCKWADMCHKTLCLTPSDSFGASSISRLKKFYKKFGFTENKGSKSDFKIKETMYRKKNK